MVKGRASTLTVTLLVSEEDAPSFGVAQKHRHKRVLTQVQLFSKHYYHTLVKPTVDANILALAEKQTVSRGERLSLRSAATDSAWANASEAIKTEIQELHSHQMDTNLNGRDQDNDDHDDHGNGNDDEGETNENKGASSLETPKDQYLSGKELEK